MSQESFFAQQEDSFSSFHGLLEHMSDLYRLHTQILLDAIRQRQEHILAPLHAGQLRQPSTAEYWEYLIDSGQRSLLFFDTLRQRGDNTLAHEREGYPLLLKFEHEVLLDGLDLPRPANYSLLRIIPGANQPVDDSRQPVIIVDPRGGHGAGIGGFKEDSEIGESLRAGHPTYFIAFSHFPAPGQTLLDIADAEAHFIEEVRRRHPDTGKPVIIGNCQAGWALMGLAAARPELPGLVIINGAPLSYWAGVNGNNPMRYAAGLLGGGWMTRLGSDLGNGRFDGTWLVSNFESLNPANTHWGKYYDLFSQVDDEAQRYLDFERWWGSPTLLNSEEIEMIVDDLFIGNRLAGSARRRSSAVDLRQIEAPVVVFCSYSDNITPPQQALNWIADVYPSDLALRSTGRTIVYLRHASIGHLGIFVSGKVARREHRELLSAIDTISALPAGLYELIIDDAPDSKGSEAAGYTVHFERRSIVDILDHDQDVRDDEREFALVDRVSELNSTLYDWVVRPVMRQLINEPLAEVIRKAHPFHQQQVLCSSLNPLLWWLPGSAKHVRNNRQQVTADNPLLAWQTLFSNLVEAQLDGYRGIRDAVQELTLHGLYGGLSTLTGGQKPPNLPERVVAQDQALVVHLHKALPHGGKLEALARIMFLLGRISSKISKERIERLIQQSRSLLQQFSLDPTTLRDTIRLQGLLVFAHPEESLSSLPQLLTTADERQQVLDSALHLVPELQTSEGDLGTFWLELHQLLERPLPDFVLTEAPVEASVKTQTQAVAPPHSPAPTSTDSVSAAKAAKAPKETSAPVAPPATTPRVAKAAGTTRAKPAASKVKTKSKADKPLQTKPAPVKKPGKKGETE
tara:strand:+ start:22854 stop:25418 length:2565 start_codon:yes stop_codon:yes gene_type:complete